MSWRYLTADQRIVFRTLDDGSMVSRLTSAIARWIADGNTVLPYVAPAAVVPQVVSRFQARQALAEAGLLPAVEAAIAQSDAKTRRAWADVVEFNRASRTVITLSAGLGLSSAQVDALFIVASTIQA